MVTAASKPDDQQDVVAYLSDPASYGPEVERVDVIETRISRVFLAGDRVYKLKRAVKYAYLNFSTPAKRQQICEAELAMNRRTAPNLYLGVRGIGRAKGGALGWMGDASAVDWPVVDWVVVMRRFDQELLFDALAQKSELTPRMMIELIDHVADFHANADARFDSGGAAAVASLEELNERGLRRTGGEFFASKQIAALHARSLECLTTVSALLDARRDAGKVRRCHGDLHLRNICLLDGKPVLFDCLEFSEDLATIDVLYDLSFLLMDLEHRRLEGLANLAANRYFDLTEEEGGLATLPLFMSIRAAIRAHVTAGGVDRDDTTDRAARQTDEARRYLDLALSVLAPQPCRLIAIGGFSGAGKSTIAQQLSPTLGTRPGARVLRSDVIRKRLSGVAPETRLPPSAYGHEMTRRVYQTVRDKAASALRAGYCVIIDAVSLREEERRSFAEVALEAGVPFSGVWLSAKAETMTQRLRRRLDDASDASPEILRQQLRLDPGPIDWVRIDVDADRDANFAAVRRALELP